MALVLGETAAGAAGFLFLMPLWREVKPGFFYLTGSIVLLLALGAAGSASAAQATGSGRTAIALSLALAGATAFWLGLMLARQRPIARWLGIATWGCRSRCSGLSPMWPTSRCPSRSSSCSQARCSPAPSWTASCSATGTSPIASSPAGRVEGPGVAAEHVRVTVRSDGCYLEDLGAPEGTFVGGVRARRIGVMHGDVVRLGRQLADLRRARSRLVRGPDRALGRPRARPEAAPRLDRSRARPRADAAPASASRGRPASASAPSRSSRRRCAKVAGEVVIVDGAAEVKPTTAAAPGARPATWLVFNADRLPRPLQLEIAHSVGRSSGVVIIATTSQPLDRATGDGHVAPVVRLALLGQARHDPGARRPA